MISLHRILAFAWALGMMMAIQTSAHPALELPPHPSPGAPVEFTIKGPTNRFRSAVTGRLLVVLGRSADPEPRERIGTTGFEAEPVLGWDLREFRSQPTSLPTGAALFPMRAGSELGDGTYYVQAILMTNRDLRLVNAPGNFYSTPQKIEVHAAHPARIEIDLDRKLPDESLPPDSEEVRYLKLPSPRLSSFWGRPMFLRAAVTLPMGWATETNRRYPLVIQIGGYGSRFFDAGPVEKRGRGFASAWRSPNGPRFLHVQLDGAGPFPRPGNGIRCRESIPRRGRRHRDRG